MVGRKKTRHTSQLMDAHIGEKVIITLGVSTSVSSEDEDGSIVKTGPLQLQGFFLDESEDFIFLGHTEKEVSCSVKKSSVIFIENDKNDALDEIIDKITPPNRGEFN
jgi:hypothetical protein